MKVREQAPRDSNDYIRSVTHLGILRANYHVVHNWDFMGEVRAMYHPKANVTEYGAMIGLHRLMSDNFRVGVGYSTGRVDDDLRRGEAPRDGVFLNFATQF